jgi:hypothetical protein
MRTSSLILTRTIKSLRAGHEGKYQALNNACSSCLGYTLRDSVAMKIQTECRHLQHSHGRMALKSTNPKQHKSYQKMFLRKCNKFCQWQRRRKPDRILDQHRDCGLAKWRTSSTVLERAMEMRDSMERNTVSSRMYRHHNILSWTVFSQESPPDALNELGTLGCQVGAQLQKGQRASQTRFLHVQSAD